MKKKKGIWKSKKKLTGLIVASLLVLVAALGFLMPNNVNRILTSVRNVFAAGDRPVINKGRNPNNDGTYKLSLSVKGEAEKKPQKANVIVVFDTSSSMNTNTGNTTTTYTPSNDWLANWGKVGDNYVELSGQWERRNGQWTYVYYYNGQEYTGQRYTRQVANQSRLEAAQEATNSLASALLANNGRDGNPADTIEIALVDFANTAVIAQAPTTDYDTFAAVVNSRDAGNNNRGTNWEAGFRTALNVDFNDSDPTYVIFVSDGNPTYYLQDPQNTQRGGTGGESTDNINTSYNQAVPAARGVVNAGYNLYTIGIYGNVDRMEDITTDAGAPAENYYSAADTAALQAAFAEILAKIEMSGIGDAVISDGTTNKVSTTTGVVELLEVDENSYKYWKTNPETGELEEWTDPENDDEIAAHLVNGAVKWDLSKLGVLENDVTYEVTFDVYPSQTTYDYIADLENGVIQYADLPAGVRKYLHQSGTALGGYSYSLDTNTEDVTLTYDDTRDEAGPQTIDFNKLNSVATTSDSISISKTWDNSIDTRTERPVSVRILKTNDDGEFQNYCFTPSCTAELNESNNWSLSDIHIATGLARLSGNKLTVLDTGHDYKFDELGSEAYNWELETETVHPMLINGVLTKLILVEKDAPDMGSDSFKTIDGKDYYKLDNGKVYVKSTDGNNIKAENHRRSNLNIKKNVTGENANPNDKFEFTIKVTQKDENGDAIADDTTTINDDLWFSICDTSIDATCKNPNSLVMDDSLVTGAQKEIRDGAWTGYYYTPNDSEVKVKLKDKYNLRFTNLVSNTDFSVVESNMTNYELDKIETTSGFESENDSKTIDKNAKKITGHIGESNTVYQVEYTNKNTKPETVEATVKKVWDDANNQDGKRPGSLEVTLSNGDKVTLNEGNSWTQTVTGLPKYKNGEEVTYTWSEDLPDGYEMTSNTTQGTITTITNKHVPETTEATVKKVWDDADDQDGKRPGSLEVTLSTGDKVTLSDSNSWTDTITGLPKYANGQEIKYTWTEGDLPAGYEMTSNTTSGTITTITNKHVPEETEATVKKVWDDANNQDGIRPTSLEVTLSNGDKVTLNAGNQWTQTVTGLPKYANGQEIKYTWTEGNLPEGYTMTSNTTSGTVTTITNKHVPGVIEVSVEKVWVDANNSQNTRPATLKVTLYANGNKADVSDAEVTLSGNNLTYTWKNLPQKANGQNIAYTVDEEKVDNYDKEITGSMSEGWTITNTIQDLSKDIPVVKTWNDGNDIDGKRPANLEVTITGKVGNETVQDATKTIQVTGTENSWRGVFKDMPIFHEGKLITYSVSEGTIPDYTMNADESNLTDESAGFKFVNVHTPEIVNVSGKKTWNDNENLDGKRPDVITVNLLADGEQIDSQTVRADESGKWNYSFTNLPKYKFDDEGNGGKEIVYTVTENVVTYYTPEYDGYDIINTHSLFTTDVTVKKTWNDSNNQDGKRPGSVTVVLKADGVAIQEQATLSDSNNWTHTWEGLDRMNLSTRQKIVYTVEEITVSEYTSQVSEPVIVEQETDTGFESTWSFEVVNDHTPEKTSATVKKVWDDADNQDGKRPGSLEVTLSNGDSVTLSDSNSWTATITGLPKYANGQEIKYTWTEGTLPTGYTMTSNTTEGTITTITNKHVPETTEATVKKVWDDANNQDGKRPGSLEVTLSNGDKVTLSDSNNWTDTVTGLPKYAGGKEIKYTWTEGDLPAGYEMTSNTTSGTITTITNKHVPEETEATVKKVWEDAGNQDGIRPDTLEVTLSNGTKVTLEKSKNYEATVTGLPKYADGKEIVYTWNEESVPAGYELISNTTDGKITTITNKHTPEVRDVTVQKEWIDDKNSQNTRPTSVTVTLKANGETAPVDVPTVTLNESNGWTYTWEGVDKKASGKDIEYTVVEEPVENYETSYDVVNGILMVINTVKDLSKDIPVEKIWDDEDDRDGLRPGTLAVTITGRVGTEVVEGASQQITLTGENGWKGTFTELPIFHEGKLISYSIEEENVAGYSVVEESTNTSNEAAGFKITNKHDPVKIKISGTKEWDDDENRDDARPESITINLLKNGEQFKSVTVVPENNNWSFEFDDLYKCEGGSAITYTLTEETVDGYSSTIGEVTEDTEVMNNYKVNVTNTHTPETITYKITKSWDDMDNNDGVRPASVTVRLLADGTEIRSTELNESNGWTYTFENLPKYRHGEVGQLIQYTIIEDEVAGYSPDYTDIVSTKETKAIENTITNKHESELHEDITVTKTWADDNNKYGVRPEKITVRLLANGKEVKVCELTAANGWTYTFTGLLKYMNGVEVVYTITEDPVRNYETKIKGFDITNIYNGPHGEIVPPNTMVSGSALGAATTNSNGGNFSVLFLLILGFVGLLFRKEANN